MNLIDALEANNVEWKHGSDDNEIWMCCPFCFEEGESPDERFRLGVNISNGKMSCFNCGKKGYGDWSFSELQRALDTGELESAEAKRKHKKKKKRRVMLPEGFELLTPDIDDEWGQKAWRYIRRRGVTSNQIVEKQIGYTVIGDYHHRIIAPIYRHQKLIGFVGRDFTDKNELKYLNSEGNKATYNLPSSTHHKSICLSEGFFDSLAIERGSLKLGIDSGGLLGHDLKDEQLEILLHMGYKYFYLWLDFDSAGIKGVVNIANKIPKDRKIKIILPNSFYANDASDNLSDPSEYESKVISKYLLRAKIFTEELGLKLRLWLSENEE